MVTASRNSHSDGCRPAAMIRVTAESASAAEGNAAAMVRAASGAGRSPSVACVITPRVPSEPTISLERS
jgi:hypothetical protein